MGWQSLKIEAPGDIAESLSDALMKLGALSVSIEDADAETSAEQPVFAEPATPPPGLWRHTIVAALFAPNVVPEQVLHKAETALGLTRLQFTFEQIEDQDWVHLTQAQFNPIRIHNDLWIVPSWHAAPQPDAINIVLDPGLAFGTGSHPTTHLCLAWLAKHLQQDETVLDYGCGSGILAIAAKKLGGGKTVGVDIDPQAIQASRNNAQQNDVSVHFALADELSDFTADIVIANILSGPLKVLAPVLADACRSGGRIVLSGILTQQASEVSATYSQWFDMQTPESLDNWVLLTGEKR
jgi:ribosomal protein L11 methyltransferase